MLIWPLLPLYLNLHANGLTCVVVFFILVEAALLSEGEVGSDRTIDRRQLL